MKEIKTYTNIWKVERTFYSFSDLRLPRPVSMTAVFWFLAVFFLSLIMDGIPPFVFDGVLVNNVAIPIFVAWFMNKKTFDGKKPYSFVRSVVSYYFMPKLHVRGKHIQVRDAGYTPYITVGKAGGRKQACRKRREEKRRRKRELREDRKKRKLERKAGTKTAETGKTKEIEEADEIKIKEIEEIEIEEGRAGHEVSS